jgi:hypothetical protein
MATFRSTPKPTPKPDPMPKRPRRGTEPEGSVVSVAQKGGEVAPLPHERDQAIGVAGTAPRKRMQQAHDDLAQGREDTDRGKVMDKVYRRQKK